jgi:aminopeptidase N
MKRPAGLLLVLVLFAALAPSPAEVPAQQAAPRPFSFAATPGKLPKSIVPEHYDVHIAPDLENLVFSGEVTIRIRVRERTRRIVLNALNLEIKSAVLGDAGGARRGLEPVIDTAEEILSFETNDPLAPGIYNLAIEYSGTINPQPQGLFYDRYSGASGDELLIATQMQPTDARRMVPCWDEPAFRATFRLSVDLPADFSAFSNTPIEETQALDGDRQRIRFESTPEMVSYLLVLVAGRLERLEGEEAGVMLGIVFPEDRHASAHYALAISRDLLGFFNDYFGLPYPLAKLDQIALPGGFGGAMENWGGIIYDEALLLYDPQKSTERTKRAVYEVVAHEIAHQWFGNLVTMAWWDDLWLNEGFASWIGTKATDRFNPDWRVWLHAGADRESAMSLDARDTTHPIQQPVANESDATDAFDDITYLKGQSFLRMLEHWLGEEDFRSGIRAYMAAHRYSNTTTADLWAALEEASGRPVARMAAAWTLQPGFPVISVSATCDDSGRRVTLSQQRFRVEGSTAAELQWPVPVAIGTAEAGTAFDMHLLDGPKAVYRRLHCDGTLLVDPEAVGYFRVAYAPELFAPLAVRFASLPDAARLKLLSDTWALAGVGRAALGDYLALLSRLGDEPERAVWYEVTDRLDMLDTLAQSDAGLRDALRRYAIGVLRPKFAKLGWEVRPEDSDEIRRLRAMLILELGRFGDDVVIAGARDRFERFLADPGSLPPSLADAIVVTAGRHADAHAYESLDTLLKEARTTEERMRYVNALSAVRDPELAARTLELSLSESLAPMIATSIPARVAYQGNIDLAWAFARDRGADLLRRITNFQRNGYFGAIVSTAADENLAAELVEVAAGYLPAEALTETHRRADEIRFNARLKARLLPQLAAFLDVRT